MQQLLILFFIIPLIGYFISLFIAKKQEKTIAAVAIATSFIQLVTIIAFGIAWFFAGRQTIDHKLVTLLSTPNFDFYIDFIFDINSFVFLFVGSLLTMLVSIFSRTYIHREEGFKKFFNNVQLFFVGYSIVMIAGNFETFFLGWELIGITSFLLISFYNNRYLPVKNAMKVVSLYRLGDVFLILSMWLSHHLWHGNITFYSIESNIELTRTLISNHPVLSTAIAICILIGASIKSAMYPFSSWVARALEGPSSSSAIFYGSLSIHLGVFLLLRTASFWTEIAGFNYFIIGIGLVTSLICNWIARSQSTVKSQIAYASIAQIGIIFIELGFGLPLLALVHFMGNAFLRTYQLLVSPSVMHYLIHNQLFSEPKEQKIKKGVLGNTIHLLSIKEFNMDTALFTYLWQPFKVLGVRLSFLNTSWFYYTSFILLIVGIYLDINTFNTHEILLNVFVYGFAMIALILLLISFNERLSSKKAWTNVFSAHLFIMMSVSINSHIELKYLLLYLASILIFGFMGLFAITRLSRSTDKISLEAYQGNGKQNPKLSLLFLVACIGLIGFPISPLYIGIDLLLTYIEKHQYYIMGIVALCLIFIEISLLRIYTRLFCGIPASQDEPTAFKSS
jgi:NADH:ubiquinone oxidoreductase subunit 5 (subunit L)/multisubunit Na+/H+ antiporter MnhA subunit